ncbi:MAG TPA: hypothetical protein VG204_12250 [Terriglobia bacterium]|nr:hypothetical protein [Terriglobia bacterium]
MRKKFHPHGGQWARRILGLAGMALAMAAVCRLADSRPVAHSIDFHDNFASGNLDKWQLPHPEDWSILAEPGGQHYLHMNRNREPGVPRRPLQFALIKGVNVGSFDFRARLRREGRSMMVVFNYVDTLHFYYAHLSMDTGRKEPVHNGIFIVNGEPRKRIAGVDAAAALPDKNWHRVRIARQARDGSIKVYMDGAQQPLFSLVDSTFTCGQLGIGSFDETGDFEDVSLKSTEAGCEPRAAASPAKAAGLR